MDTKHLQQHYQELLDYLKKNGYKKKDSIWMARRCISMALSDGIRNEVKNYEDLFRYEVSKLGFRPEEGRFHSLKSYIGMVWDFDVNGRFPQGVGSTRGFMSKPSKYDQLPDEFRHIIDNHINARRNAGKTDKTIYTECNAGIVFFFYAQERGARCLADITPPTLYSFFSDGERQLRGKSFCHLVKEILESASGSHPQESARLLKLLPRIRDKHKLYDYLSIEESQKIFDCLKDESTPLSKLERAVGWMLYFWGMRGTDIGRMKFSNLDWKHERIHINQSKTGVPLMVPINAAIGNAIFDYITLERPAVERNTVFVRRHRPHNGFAELGGVINKVFKVAGIRADGGTRGVRTMRHHLVTYMLKSGIDCATVSSMVGHKDGKSLVPYVDADTEHLRECAISVEPYPVNPKIFAL